VVFGLKAGLGFGGAIGGYVLDIYGYVPNVEQSPEAIMGIRMTVAIYPAIAFIAALIALAFYKIDRKTEFQIQDELAERRKAFEQGK
jgi:GPH family glycoside/pentoside/hexuronide:cation symporter